jgi:uncharacterized membrane protein
VVIQTFLFFAYPLIVERRINGWDAVRLSARAVWQNLGGVLGFVALEILLGIVGYMFYFVGVYFAFPLMFAGAFVAYRKVFPKTVNQNFNSPPPPDAFGGAGSYT